MMIATPESARFVSWVHFGDLHIREAEDENYEDFLDLIEHANDHLADEVDFALLPGDNADDGTEDQYRLVRKALDRLQLPFHAIAGDHDKLPGDLSFFQQYLESDLYRVRDLRGYRLLFLNALDGKTPKSFDVGSQQLEWLNGQLSDARSRGIQPVVFFHLYPSKLETRAGELSRLLRDNGVLLVEMGHTHYNELANDGHTIYAATRSTGQIQEGPPGFSITTLDNGVVSWKFKEIGPWPFAMITSPSDRRLIIDPQSSEQVIRGSVLIRGRVWNSAAVDRVSCQVDEGTSRAMTKAAEDLPERANEWTLPWDSSTASDGEHRLTIEAYGYADRRAEDSIVVVVSQSGRYTAPERASVDAANAIGPYPLKGILGTQLGPNENGTKGRWPSWRHGHGTSAAGCPACGLHETLKRTMEQAIGTSHGYARGAALHLVCDYCGNVQLFRLDLTADNHGQNWLPQ